MAMLGVSHAVANMMRSLSSIIKLRECKYLTLRLHFILTMRVSSGPIYIIRTKIMTRARAHPLCLISGTHSGCYLSSHGFLLNIVCRPIEIRFRSLAQGRYVSYWE